MREIPVSRITDAVERLCIEANTHLPDDVKRAIEACRACEDGDIAVGVLDNIIENYHIADRECVPICQDTGMACVFLEIGQDVHLTGGDLREAVDEGVRRGYTNGLSAQERRPRPRPPGQHRRQHPCRPVHRDRSRRAGEDHPWPQGLRQREHERHPDVQALRRTAGHQGFYP